jgi:hypothetical protein
MSRVSGPGDDLAMGPPSPNARYPVPRIGVRSGLEHEMEVRGFVDVRLDNVGEWGEEDPGAFMAKGGIEQLTLRTCTAGDVLLCWSSDNIGLYTDFAWEEEDRVVEDDGSVQGSRRATFSPEFPTPADKDHWDTIFRTTCLWAKALQTSSIVGDIHLALSPVTGQGPSDLVSLSIVELRLETLVYRPSNSMIIKPPGAYRCKSTEKGGRAAHCTC